MTDNLANILKNIFFTDLLTVEKRGSIIDDKLVDEFDETKERGIDLVDGRINFNNGQVELIKMMVDCTQE